MESERESFQLESCVRGHYIYKRVWTPVVGQVLNTSTEPGNHHDRFAVAVLQGDSAVGHIPRESTRVA